jgi:hypothetical protein
LADWLVGWLVGWLVDWLTECLLLCLPTVCYANHLTDEHHPLQDIWSLRENVPVALARLCKNGSVDGPFLFKYDISVPRVRDMLLVAEEVRRDFLADGFCVADGHDLSVAAIAKETPLLSGGGATSRAECVLRVYCYGHVGDQNLHLNVILR